MLSGFSSSQESDLIIKFPKHWDMGRICFLWHLRGDWYVILSLLCQPVLCLMSLRPALINQWNTSKVSQTENPVCHPAKPIFHESVSYEPSSSLCVSTALNVKKQRVRKRNSSHKGNSIAFHCSSRPFRLKANIPFDECGCWKKIQGSSSPCFLVCGKEGRERNVWTPQLPRACHGLSLPSLAKGKGNWKVCAGSSADRRQTTCQVSRSCFAGQLIRSSWLRELLRLLAIISLASCIHNWIFM